MTGRLVLVLGIFLSARVQATEIFEDYVSPRALGMGNAFSAVVDDKDALFYNPAGLDRIRGFHLTVMDPSIGTDAYDAYTTYQNATGGGYAQLIQSFFGKTVWVGIQDTLAVSLPDFAVAGYDAFNLSFNLHDPAYANLNFNVTDDVGVVFGTAVSLVPSDAVRFGIVGKRVTRYGGRVSLGPSILATLSNSALTSLINGYGTGYGADAGFLFEMPSDVKPTFSFVWHDIGQTQFQLASGTAPPPSMDDNLVAGYAMTIKAPGVTITPALDFTHMTLWSEEIGKRIQAGVEFAFPALSIRAGLNQGYYTLGVGLDFSYLRIEAATYGVELDTYPGQLEDRRYIVQFTIDFNFDLHLGSDKTSTSDANGVSRSYLRR